MNRPELPPDRGRPPTRAEVAAYGEQLSAYVAFLRERYGTLYDDLCRLLDQHDPIGIARPEYPEYDSEVQTILPRLHEAQSADDVSRIVHEEFVRWFDGQTAGSVEEYRDIGKGIWPLWERYQAVRAES